MGKIDTTLHIASLELRPLGLRWFGGFMTANPLAGQPASITIPLENLFVMFITVRKAPIGLRTRISGVGVCVRIYGTVNAATTAGFELGSQMGSFEGDRCACGLPGTNTCETMKRAMRTLSSGVRPEERFHSW